MVERQIKSWLEAGILDTSGNSEGRIEENTVGTPQGGTLSPLLANIALDGMEKRLYEELRNKVRIIRFADDFVVFSDKLENVLASKKILAQYLKPIGLEFSKEKTRIGHTMTPYEGQKPGLDFLGFNFKNYKVSKHRGVKKHKRSKAGISSGSETQRQGYKETQRCHTKNSKSLQTSSNAVCNGSFKLYN